jgi:Protein of unknown function (DUF4031)
VTPVAVLIDPPRWPAHGRLWSHLVSDSNLDELHEFARHADIPRRGFEGDHYDVPGELRAQLIALGAQPVESRELLQRLVASGLRIPKRRGEKVISSRWDSWLPGAGPQRVDVVLSTLDVPADAVVGRWVVITDLQGRLLVARSPDGGWDLPEQAALDGVHAAARPIGYVRGWHEGTPPAGYPYPSPWTFAPILRAELPAAVTPAGVRWTVVEEAERLIGRRFAWPLVERVLEGRA